MKPHLLNRLKARIDKIPGCLDYADLLDYAHATKGLPLDELRRKMGLATYGQWADYLNID